MKNVKRFIAIAMVPTLFPLAAFTQELQVPKTEANPAGTVSEQATPAANSLWDKAKRELLNTNLKIKINLPTIRLAKGLELHGDYQFKSEESIAGKYSGIDVWDVNLSAYSALFDITDIDIGLNFGRQVTFIRQYDSRIESLKRLPYDPITKVPKNSSYFFKKTKNPFTGLEEPTFESGDFIAYRAPMTIGVGKTFSRVAAGHLGLSVGLNYAVSGEFDVHVFVMNDNMVRVKLILAKDKTKGGNVGVSLFGFTGPGQMIIDKILDGRLLDAYYSKTRSELFTGDYVFNLNTEEGREQYDKLVGSKLHAFNKKMIKEQLRLANPFSNDDRKQSKMLASFDEVNEISNEDINKPARQRRVIKVANIHNVGETETVGMKINVLKILKLGTQESKSQAAISIFAKDASGGKDMFRLDTKALENNFKFVVWGDNNRTSSSLLTQVDDTETPNNFMGLQSSRVRETTKFKKKDYDEYLNGLKELLPDSIYSKLEKPDWDFSSGSVKKSHIEEDITFNDKLFTLPMQISFDQIKAALIDILQKHKSIESLPMGAQANGGGDSGRDPRSEAFQMKRYVDAYDGWELQLIPTHLSVALNSGYAYKDRYEALKTLNNTVPLFGELQALLLMRLIPENLLERILLARLVMSAANQKAVISTYPTTESYNTSTLFREILSQNTYATNRSFNLRYYIKEDGSLYSLEEIMLQK